MDLDAFIIAVFCVLGETVPRVIGGRRLRQRGPQPVLADSEVLTIEVVGEYLRLEQDSALFAYFQRHYTHFFPTLRRLHRTTFVHQAASLQRRKEHLWQQVLTRVPHDPTFAIVDSFPQSVCQFARAYRCRRFQDAAAFEGYKGQVGMPDVLWAARACAAGMARRDHALLPRASQRA